MRISDWSSDVCSSDLWIVSPWKGAYRSSSADKTRRHWCFRRAILSRCRGRTNRAGHHRKLAGSAKLIASRSRPTDHALCAPAPQRSEEHTSELQSLMRISYAVFCLKKKKKLNQHLTK